MAYLSKATPNGSNGEANESTSSGMKLMIIVIFVCALGLLAAALVLQFKNRDRLARLMPADGTANVPVSTADPSLLGEWEMVQVAEKIAARVRQYNAYLEQDPDAFGDQTESLRRGVPALVQQLVRDEMNIRNPEIFQSGAESALEWEPPRGDQTLQHLRNRFVFRTYTFMLNGVSREQIVALALTLEDKYPWMTVQSLTIERIRGQPDDRRGVPWSARFVLQWWEERARSRPTS